MLLFLLEPLEYRCWYLCDVYPAIGEAITVRSLMYDGDLSVLLDLGPSFLYVGSTVDVVELFGLILDDTLQGAL